MTIQYLSSKGPVSIDSMPLPYASNALGKLKREDPTRAAEIEALSAHVARLSEEHVERGEAHAPAEHNPRAVVGGNHPPAEEPVNPDAFDALKANADDLYAEAKHWLDGAEITSDAEAEGVSLLLEKAREAYDAAEAQRKKEVKPLDDAKTAIQEKFRPIIGDTKAGKGTMVRLQEVCKAALTPWRAKKVAEAAAAAEAIRKEAEAKAAEAAAAMQASAGDLDATEAAEELVQAAQDAQRDANRATKAATTGTGLSTYYEPVLTSASDALKHYVKTRPDDVRGYLLRLAQVDVRNGARTIPGFAVEEQKRAR